jgi:DNA-binding phage protein
MWLATIDTSRLANDEARAKLVRWQCEAADVLDKWARGGDQQPVTIADMQKLLAGFGHGFAAGPDVMHHMEALAAAQRKMGEVVVELRQTMMKKSEPRFVDGNDYEVAANVVDMATKAGLSRSSFYRVLAEHPDLRERCQRGRGWLIDATLSELARLGKVRRRAEGRITESEFMRCIAEAPGEVLTTQQLDNLSEQDPSLPWQACECRVGGTIDRAVLSALATYGSLAGLHTIARAIHAAPRTVARSVHHLQQTGALLVDGTEPGQERRYHMLQRVILTHTESCPRRMAS